MVNPFEKLFWVLSDSPLPPKQLRQISTTLDPPGPSVEPDVPPLQTANPFCKKTGPVGSHTKTLNWYRMMCFVRHHTIWMFNDCAQTKDQESLEGSEPGSKSDSEDGVTEQGSVDTMGFLHALWKIHKGLFMQSEGIKHLINVI